MVGRFISELLKKITPGMLICLYPNILYLSLGGTLDAPKGVMLAYEYSMQEVGAHSSLQFFAFSTQISGLKFI